MFGSFLQKTYGNWWKEAPSRTIEYMPQNTPRIPSSDYVGKNPNSTLSFLCKNTKYIYHDLIKNFFVGSDVAFEQSVYPFRVSIYETYNPGSVVRIWAKNDSSHKRKWALLWEGEPTMVGHVPRIFSPVIYTVNFKTRYAADLVGNHFIQDKVAN